MRAVLALTLLLSACAGSEPAAPAKTDAATPAKSEAAAAKVNTYGDPITLTESVPVSKLLAEVDQYDGKRVRVEGIVSEVCAKRGCWMDLAGDAAFQKLRFKVQDGVITIPMDEKGRYAVAEGVVKKITLSPEDALAMAEHEAEEMGRPVDKTQPLPTYIVQLQGVGAQIRDRQ